MQCTGTGSKGFAFSTLQQPTWVTSLSAWTNPNQLLSQHRVGRQKHTNKERQVTTVQNTAKRERRSEIIRIFPLSDQQFGVHSPYCNKPNLIEHVGPDWESMSLCSPREITEDIKGSFIFYFWLMGALSLPLRLTCSFKWWCHIFDWTQHSEDWTSLI